MLESIHIFDILTPEEVVVIETMIVLPGEVLLKAALHTNGVDAEIETVIHFPSETRNATYQRVPVGSPKRKILSA